MTRKDLERAIEKEVEAWPGVSVSFAEGGKHPKAKFVFVGPDPDAEPMTIARPFPGTPSDAAFGVHRTLGDMRRAMKQLGAARSAPEPSKDEDEAPYRKPNDGREKRPDPVKGERAELRPDAADQLVLVGAATEEQRAVARAPARFVQGEVLAPVADPLAAREVREIVLAEFLARVDAIVDGVYFDLPDEVYHAVPRLSASGLQKLCVSPANFWRGSWFDPEKKPLDEEQTLAQLLGKAYHVARLEPDRFERTYFRGLDKADHPTALFTADQMKAVCEDIGLKKSGTKDELADRLVDFGYIERPIWTVVERRWEEERAGRIALPAKHYDQMATDMGRIRENEVAELLVGGFAEVSIFYTDQYGIKMKSRIDYLTLIHWADFKTFENSRGKELEKAIADAFQFNRYYLQAVSYRDAVEAVRVGGLDVIEGNDAQRDFVTQLRLAPHELDCHYVFQEKNGVPNLLAYQFMFYAVPFSTIFNEAITDDETRKQRMRELTANKTRLFIKGLRQMIEAKKQFVAYSQVFPAGTGTPWYPHNPRRELTDEMFHPAWLEDWS